jgi:hypothetical protein
MEAGKEHKKAARKFPRGLEQFSGLVYPLKCGWKGISQWFSVIKFL